MATVTVATLAGTAAPAALAADDCVNAAVRAQQSATHLPSCLAYERVSPADKNGAAPGTKLAITADGNRLLFGMNSAVGDATGFLTGNYRATRSADGWGLNSVTPPFNVLPPKLVDSAEFVGWSDDLDRVLLRTRYPVNANDTGRQSNGNGASDLYLREPDGSYTWVVPNPSVADNSTLDVTALATSTDLDRVVLSTARPFDSRVTTTNLQHVYVWSKTGGTKLATVLPNGDLPTELPTYNGVTPTRAASADGRRIAFSTIDGGFSHLFVRFNADDAQTAVTREVAVGPNGEACQNYTSSPLHAISADGTKVVFECDAALLPGAPRGAAYIRDLDGGPAAVSLVGALGDDVLGNEDFSQVYFTSPDKTRLLVLRDGVVETAVPASGTAALSDLAISEDGNTVVFGRVDANSFTRLYTYSARTGDIACISCRADGGAVDGSSMLRGGISNAWSADPITPVSDDGRVIFSSSAALDPRDTNGMLDAYAWVDGRTVLLSSGRGGEPAVAHGMSRDGQSLVFGTSDALVGDDNDGGGYDIYMARQDGGFLLPDAPTECTSACQAPGPERPSLPGIGSQNFAGRGNVVEEAASNAPRATASLTASRSVRGKSTTVRVKVSRAGSIRVSGAGLRQATVKAKKAGTYRVTVRLSAHGQKQQSRRGRLVTKVTARFTPQSGSPVQARKSVTFTATKKGGR